MTRPRRLLGFIARLSLGLLLGGCLSTLLVRFAPGFGVDERELDPSLSEATRARFRDESTGPGVWSTYGQYLRGALHGDFGYSSSLNTPVSQLVADRAPVTARAVAGGLALAWIFALPLAIASVLWRTVTVPLVAGSVLLLCLPVGLVAVYFFLMGLPAAGVIAAGAGPKVFTYLRQLLNASGQRPHVLGARARGVRPWRVLLLHEMVPIAPEVLSLLGVTVVTALGAAIPAEALCDSPGLGQLAWKAAVARDTAPLLAMTWLMTGVAFTANTLGAALADSGRKWRA